MPLHDHLLALHDYGGHAYLRDRAVLVHLQGDTTHRILLRNLRTRITWCDLALSVSGV